MTGIDGQHQFDDQSTETVVIDGIVIDYSFMSKKLSDEKVAAMSSYRLRVPRPTIASIKAELRAILEIMND